MLPLKGLAFPAALCACVILISRPQPLPAQGPTTPAKSESLLPGQETRSPDDFELFLERILEAPRGQRNPGVPNYVPAARACTDCPCCPLPPAPDPVARLIKQLGDDNFARREQASKELEAIGETTRPGDGYHFLTFRRTKP
jgi:hypothetical protein